MNHIESMLWCFCVGFILVFMGLYLLINEGFAYSLSIKYIWLRLIISYVIIVAGVALFNIGLHIKKSIKIIQIQ